MAQIIWTQPALSDLNDVANYIALDNFTAAERLVRNVFAGVERLEQFPDSGRIPPELQNSQYREIIIEPCRIFYRKAQDKVYIVYLMRSERQLRKYIIDDRTQKK